MMCISVKTSGRPDVRGGWSVVVVSTLGIVVAHPAPDGGAAIASTATGSVRVPNHDTPGGAHCGPQPGVPPQPPLAVTSDINITLTNKLDCIYTARFAVIPLYLLSKNCFSLILFDIIGLFATAVGTCISL